jgi:hypothetical protein
MGRTAFIAWLYVMSGACVIGAAAERSWGWLFGGIVFFAVATFARKKLRKEYEQGRREAPRLSFFAMAMLAMLGGMGLLYWLSTSA